MTKTALMQIEIEREWARALAVDSRPVWSLIMGYMHAMHWTARHTLSGADHWDWEDHTLFLVAIALQHIHRLEAEETGNV
jgi:hypothetical protein